MCKEHVNHKMLLVGSQQNYYLIHCLVLLVNEMFVHVAVLVTLGRPSVSHRASQHAPSISKANGMRP